MNKIQFQLLIYGSYAILCQLSFLFLLVGTQSERLNSDILYHRYFPFLEYPLSSILILLGGVLLLKIALSNHQ